MTSLVMTWNAGASKPTDLRYDEKNSNFFREMLQARQPPDVIVFGLQEIVDLEDKRLTASKSSAGMCVRHLMLIIARNILQGKETRRSW